MGEVVALVCGGGARRRAVLERAGSLAGASGVVHVVCDGSLAVKMAGAFVLQGLTLDTEHWESASFAQAADALAPYACGWTWSHAVAGARAEAIAFAVRFGLPMVLPGRMAWPWTSEVVVTGPAAADLRRWYVPRPAAGRGIREP